MPGPESRLWTAYQSAVVAARLGAAQYPGIAERTDYGGSSGGRPDVLLLCGGCERVSRIELKAVLTVHWPTWDNLPWNSPAQPSFLKQWWRYGGAGGVLARGTKHALGWAWYGPLHAAEPTLPPYGLPTGSDLPLWAHRQAIPKCRCLLV